MKAVISYPSQKAGGWELRNTALLAVFQGVFKVMKIYQRLLQIALSVSLLTTALTFAAGQTADQPDSSAQASSAQAGPEQASPPQVSQASDPSGRVARLEYMNGSVSVQPHGTDDWVEGSVNRPLTNADNVWADKDSRAELNLGTGFMRISSETSLTLTNVTNDSVQAQLHQGALNVDVRHLYDGETYEIDTPNQAFTITKNGEYRFDVDPNADTTVVTVRKGEGESTGEGQPLRIQAGERVTFTGGKSLQHQVADATSPDSFDQWCKTRDDRDDNSVSAKYVAPGVVGTRDLDDYGTWRDTSEYGHVWVPTAVAPGWAPYHNGHWAWVDPWGWTWVDDAPWGFAPFHYGRWVAFNGYWGWAPGPYYVRPYYAPALVAWYGGPRWGVGFGFGFGGGFGWCPLGFGEPFFPWYRASGFYFRNVNISNTRITNITNITNIYNRNGYGAGYYGRNGIGTPRYASRPGAFTAVSSNTLTRGLPVAANSVRVSPSALRSAPSIGRPNVSPTREATLGPKTGVSAAHPSLATTTRPTVSRMQPTTSARSTTPAARGPENSGARNTAAPSPARGSETQAGARSMPQPAGRFIPRPPSASGLSARSGSSGSTQGSNHSEPSLMAMNHNIPRPPVGSVRPEPSSTGARSGSMTPSNSSRSVPRPPQGSMNRPTMSARNTAPSMSAGPRSFGNSNSGHSMPTRVPTNVPRPSGRIQPAPRSYSAPSRSNYSASARSYGQSSMYGGSRGYSGSPSAGSPYGGSSRSYSGGGGGRSYSAPSSRSYGGGSYGGSSHGGSPSYGGGGSYHGSSGGSSHGGRAGR